MAQVVIIGAGLTGLSTAYHLEKNGFFDYALFEKEKTAGGLCRSIKQHGFIFDYTGHLLHCNDTYAHTFLRDLSAKVPLTQAQRSSHIYSYDTLTPYPYQQQLYGLPPTVIADCIEGYAQRKKTLNPRSFIAWVNTHFGSGLGKHFFFPYQEKLFDYDLEKLSASWTGRFVPSTSLRHLITGAVAPLDTTQIGYNARFFYPTAGGIQQLMQALEHALVKPIMTRHLVDHIDIPHKKITFTNGKTEFYETLISTMPLNQFLEKSTNQTFSQAAQKLHCTSVFNVNLGIAHEIHPRTHWIYYPEKKYPFYRIGFPHLLSPAMAPCGASSLSIEIAYTRSKLDRPTSKASLAQDKEFANNERVNQAISYAKKLFQFHDKDILTHAFLKLPHAYVVYDRWRDKHIDSLLSTLATHNIYSIGRYGSWKYSSMQEAILDGKHIVENLCKTLSQQYIHAKQTPDIYSQKRYHL